MGKRPNARLLISSVVYVIISISSLTTFSVIVHETLFDIKTASKIHLDQTPCGIGVPNLADLVYGNGFERFPITGSPASSESFFAEIKNTMCRKETVSEALQTLYQDTKTIEANNAGVKAAVCDRSSIEGYLMRHLDPPLFVDPVSRITRAFMRASPAFYHYNSNIGVGGACNWPMNPFISATACLHNTVVEAQLAAAAVSSFEMVKGSTAAIPDVETMLYALTALSLVSVADRDSNNGKCFKNDQLRNPSALCGAIYAGATGGTSTTVNAVQPWESVYAPTTNDAIAAHDLCLESPDRVPPPSPPPSPQVAYNEYEMDQVATLPGYIRHCIRTHEFAQYDIDILFGIPDFEKHGSETIRGLRGLVGESSASIYEAMREAWFLDHRKVEALDSPRREAMLFSAYRLGATLVWATPALCVACYWLARGALPIIVIGLPVLRKCFSANAEKPQKAERPAASPIQWIAVLATILTGVYMISVDPFATSLYQRDHCEEYEKEGAVWGTSRSIRSTGYAAIVMMGIIIVYVLAMELCFAGKKLGRVPRTSGILSFLAIAAVLVSILMEVFLIVESVDKWVDQITKFLGNEPELEEHAGIVRTDVNALVTTVTLTSWSIGILTMRWVVYKGNRFGKKLWLLCGIVPPWIAYLARVTSTSSALSDSHSEGGYSARNASLYTTLVVSLFLTAVFFFFYREAANKLSAWEKKQKMVDKAREAVENSEETEPLNETLEVEGRTVQVTNKDRDNNPEVNGVEVKEDGVLPKQSLFSRLRSRVSLPQMLRRKQASAAAASAEDDFLPDPRNAQGDVASMFASLPFIRVDAPKSSFEAMRTEEAERIEAIFKMPWGAAREEARQSRHSDPSVRIPPVLFKP